MLLGVFHAFMSRALPDCGGWMDGWATVQAGAHCQRKTEKRLISHFQPESTIANAGPSRRSPFDNDSVCDWPSLCSAVRQCFSYFLFATTRPCDNELESDK